MNEAHEMLKLAKAMIGRGWGGRRFKPGDVVQIRGERGEFTVVKRSWMNEYTIEDENGRKMNWYTDEYDMRIARQVI